MNDKGPTDDAIGLKIMEAKRQVAIFKPVLRS